MSAVWRAMLAAANATWRGFGRLWDAMTYDGYTVAAILVAIAVLILAFG